MKQEVFSMYENNDPNTENNESSTYRYTPERGTQSDYTAGAHNAKHQDKSYRFLYL